MLREAAARGGYDELLQGELVAFVRTRRSAWDLIASADTLCYIGDLAPFAVAAAEALRSRGLLVFTVEAHDDHDDHDDHDTGPGFRLQPHGRYSHARRYVDATLRSAGLELLELGEQVLRSEALKPVRGWLVVARATSPA
jgi:predicted TPR repeat methyltransferase